MMRLVTRLSIKGKNKGQTQELHLSLFLILRIGKITQRAFAEYHSKRNYVERLHAVENDVLSRHGAFDY